MFETVFLGPIISFDLFITMKSKLDLEILTTHREQLEEWVLEHHPFFILVSNHWNINVAEILGEQ